MGKTMVGSGSAGSGVGGVVIYEGRKAEEVNANPPPGEVKIYVDNTDTPEICQEDEKDKK